MILRTLVLAALLATPGARGIVQPQTNESIHVSTITATVERLDRALRGLTCRMPDGSELPLIVDASVKLYDDLRVGDVIVIAVIDAVVVKVKPGAKLTNPTDTTEAARARVQDPLVQVTQQVTGVVTIEEIDRKAQTVVYKGPDNRRVLRMVRDPRLLDDLRRGDVVEVTLTRERAVSIERAGP
jgi:hypothetical protein